MMMPCHIERKINCFIHFIYLFKKSLSLFAFLQAGEGDQERYAVSRITLHPQFRQGALFNYDFAVVQLARHVDFLRMPGIRPACLPPRQQTMEQLTGHR
jgi:hypothetical protein